MADNNTQIAFLVFIFFRADNYHADEVKHADQPEHNGLSKYGEVRSPLIPFLEVTFLTFANLIKVNMLVYCRPNHNPTYIHVEVYLKISVPISTRV